MFYPQNAREFGFIVLEINTKDLSWEVTRNLSDAIEKTWSGNVDNLITHGNLHFSCPGRHQQLVRTPSCGIIDQGIYALNPNHRRCTMKVTQAVDFHLQYHRTNSKKKYGQDQRVCPLQVLSKILQSWTGQYLAGRSAGFPFKPDQRQQTGDEKESVFRSLGILQFQHQHRLAISI